MHALNITAEEAGDYECHAANPFGTAIDSISIIVRRRLLPLITIAPNVPILTINEGDQLNLVCSADGSPLPIAKWTRSDGSPISSSYSAKGMASVTKFQVEKIDEGTYICNAKNIAGEAIEKIKIVIKPKPIHKHIIRVGDDVKLSCKLNNSNKVIYWLRQDGKPLPTTAMFDGDHLVRP